MHALVFKFFSAAKAQSLKIVFAGEICEWRRFGA